PQSAGAAGVALVDHAGGLLGGDTRATSALPVASRLAAAIAGRQSSFSDVGQNGATYAFNIRPLPGDNLFVIGAMPAERSFAVLMLDWGEFGLILVASIALLVLLWLGADRWCVRP